MRTSALQRIALTRDVLSVRYPTRLVTATRSEHLPHSNPTRLVTALVSYPTPQHAGLAPLLHTHSNLQLSPICREHPA